MFLRDIMIDQRGGEPATFEYTTRGWKLKVFIVSIPFQDAVREVLREFTIEMKVQEDVSGVMTKNSLSAELRRLQDGVGFKRSKYNDPALEARGPGSTRTPVGAASTVSATPDATETRSEPENSVPGINIRSSLSQRKHHERVRIATARYRARSTPAGRPTGIWAAGPGAITWGLFFGRPSEQLPMRSAADAMPSLRGWTV